MTESESNDTSTEDGELTAEQQLAALKKVVPFAVRNLGGPFRSGLDPSDPADPARLYLLKSEGVGV